MGLLQLNVQLLRMRHRIRTFRWDSRRCLLILRTDLLRPSSIILEGIYRTCECTIGRPAEQNWKFKMNISGSPDSLRHIHHHEIPRTIKSSFPRLEIRIHEYRRFECTVFSFSFHLQVKLSPPSVSTTQPHVCLRLGPSGASRGLLFPKHGNLPRLDSLLSF